ncbi:hypothetical protein LTR66_004564 [Elasticomyces elasticus]|nr:hypothetical protein LTR66_004564 [Elasticomyces elasticus]
MSSSGQATVTHLSNASLKSFDTSNYDFLTERNVSQSTSMRKALLMVDASYPLSVSPPSTSTRPRRLSLYRRKGRPAGRWGSLGTRKKAVIIAAIIVTILALAIGLGAGIPLKRRKPKSPITSRWRPAIGTPWNIQLNTTLTDLSGPVRTYDIDLFAADKGTIDRAHQLNKKVICYFSAGTYEDWRPDAHQFSHNDLGGNLADWPGEKWLNTASRSVRNVMLERLNQAQSKGCDGVDPDNVDGYLYNDNGFKLTNRTAVDYLTFLTDAAHARQMAIGLKNGADLVLDVLAKMDWAVVEGCADTNECVYWHPFIAAGRPVLSIDYVDGPNATALSRVCTSAGTTGFSTVFKHRALDEWYLACPVGATAVS